MVAKKLNSDTDKLWEYLREVPDPEIPAINLVELGVVRDIEKVGDKVVVTITPTYTGCPAKKLFNDLIIEKLQEKGIEKVEIVSQLFPAWNTDWLSEETRQKLLDEGISPPTIGNKIVICPHCRLENTKLLSEFGSTPCQAMYTCQDCLETFNYFKCLR
ncbi:MAG: 1,2-phenylacetyl-CoA epoxidase subunit PaaD [Crocinitomicaceae bacterium]